MVNFYRGLASSFDKTKHKDGLYFAMDAGEIYLNDAVFGSQYAIADIKVKEDGTGLIVQYSNKNIVDREIKLIDLLLKASSKSAGLMSSQDKINLDKIYEAYTIGELTRIKGIVDDEKMLSLDANGKLFSNINLEYYTDSNKVPYIRLTGKNGSVIGTPINASVFVKDGMLNNIDIVKRNGGTFIEMVFNTDSGVSEPKYVDVSDIFTVYTAGDGISIENNVIKVKVYSSDPYLTVDSDGIKTKGITEAINAVKSVIIGSEDDSEDSQTIYGVKKYVDSVVTSSVKVKDVDSTASNGVNLSLNEGVVKVITDVPVLAEKIAEKLSGTIINIGESVVAEDKEIISANTSITQAIQTLENQIQESLAVKTFSITGDDYISVNGTSTEKNLAINVTKIASTIVDNSTALKVEEDGKFYIRWENFNNN